MITGSIRESLQPANDFIFSHLHFFGIIIGIYVLGKIILSIYNMSRSHIAKKKGFDSTCIWFDLEKEYMEAVKERERNNEKKKISP